MHELKPTPLTIPLSWIYGRASALYHATFDRGIRKTVDLGRPVVSVGNLVVGGTGKTPVVVALAQAIVGHDLSPAILTRGYGGSRTGLLRDGQWQSGEPAGIEAGDEPLLLSRMLPGVTIGVGKDRARMSRRILDRERVDVVLLDDGFQHRRIARQANVLLLDADTPFGNRRLLPAGPLREPPSAIKRADAILLTGGGGAGHHPHTLRNFNGPVWATRLRLERFETLSGVARPDPDRPVMAVAGIARPERFYEFLKAHGLELVGMKTFPDHHAYRPSEVRELESMSRGTVLVTTAKDAVRLAPLVTGNAEWSVATICIDIEGGWNAFLERILPELFPKKERSGWVAAPSEFA